MRLHDLRHAHASELIGGGVDVIATSKRLGHSSPSVTMNVYGHALRANDQRAAAMIGALLAEKDSEPEDEG